ncbi:MAG: histidine phosphotransferase [Boseongicola sp.]|nr:histidine phosphotransferase [Boseongicola sp.]
MTGTDLNALISSRICHDLISPLGAIGNGVELLTMSGQGNSPEIALIAESVENANARIRFFRIAFGAANPDVEISQSEVQNVLRDCFRANRTSIEWTVEGALARADIKLVFLVVQCLENALPWGGQISVSRSGANWKLDAKGEKIKTDAALWRLITDRTVPSDVAASDVHFALVTSAAENANRRVATFFSDTQVTITF